MVQEVKKYEAPTTSAAATSEKLKRPPFGKDLFLGVFDTEVLSFPEVLDRDRLETLDAMIAPLEKFFEESIDSKKIDAEAKIPKETLEGLKELGLFGQQIPVEYGGLGLNATEFARIGEVTALDGSIAVTLAAHQSIGLKVIWFKKQITKQKLFSHVTLSRVCSQQEMMHKSPNIYQNWLQENGQQLSV